MWWYFGSKKLTQYHLSYSKDCWFSWSYNWNLIIFNASMLQSQFITRHEHSFFVKYLVQSYLATNKARNLWNLSTLDCFCYVVHYLSQNTLPKKCFEAHKIYKTRTWYEYFSFCFILPCFLSFSVCFRFWKDKCLLMIWRALRSPFGGLQLIGLLVKFLPKQLPAMQTSNERQIGSLNRTSSECQHWRTLGHLYLKSLSLSLICRLLHIFHSRNAKYLLIFATQECFYEKFAIMRAFRAA